MKHKLQEMYFSLRFDAFANPYNEYNFSLTWLLEAELNTL